MTRYKLADAVFPVLKEKYPNVSTFLTHETPFQLLIAVILSAQCTDERVNKVTPGLFESFPTPETLSEAPLDAIKEKIKSVNFFNNKSKNIKETAKIIHEDHQDKVPPDIDKLVKLPGVGRKTANVVLGQAFNIPGITCDTHVMRVSRRLGFTKHTDPIKVEKDLMKKWRTDTWIDFSTTAILHGRHICKAQRPDCDNCEFLKICHEKTKK